MRVNVVHPAGRLARQARREIVIDVADRVIEEIEHFEDRADASPELVTEETDEDDAATATGQWSQKIGLT